MTVVGLGDGKLLVHSPVPLDDPTAAKLAALGEVRQVVAPSCLHHRFVAPLLQWFPGAQLFGARGLPARRPELAFAALLDDPGPRPWAKVLDQVTIEGAPRLNEVVFLHLPSRSLIVSDLLFNVRNPETWTTALVLRLAGTHRRLAMSRAWRLYTRDRVALRASVERVLAWDFARILPGHGDVFDDPDTRRHARTALRWAL